MKLTVLIAVAVLAGALVLWWTRRRIEERIVAAGTRTNVPSPEALADARVAARELSSALAEVGTNLSEGMSTNDVNSALVRELRSRGLEPVMNGFNGYPSDSNVSVNEEVLHAPPSDRPLKAGDLVTIQTSVRRGRGFANQPAEGGADARP